MREILFRGKRIDNGDWTSGFYQASPAGNHYITSTGATGCARPDKVDPNTVVQYTGLTDKNGQMIFEGDLVQAVLPQTTAQMGFVWPIMPVVFSNGTFGLLDHREDVTPFRSFAPRVTFEVLGNIHDNPDLLKGE